MLDLFLIATLGFFGSFGHCVGMCGPLAVAFALSDSPSDTTEITAVPESVSQESSNLWRSFRFHALLNIGRILSYACFGALIGGVGSVLIAGGQMAGLGSVLRRAIALLTGSLLIWYGLWQINPQILPRLPFLHPFLQEGLHHRLNQVMAKLADKRRWWTPALLGTVWGLVPCGFLYAAQLKAAETGSVAMGSLTMLAFGAGTMPAMVSMGALVGRLSQDRRGQLFRMGGWVTLSVGILTILRTGDAMADYAGHSAIALLALSLIARPLASIWHWLLTYRRALGVGAFALSCIHILHALQHSWGWNWQVMAFMLPHHQAGIWLGAIAATCMLPAAATSFNRAQQTLGKNWRRIHLLAIPALILCVFHAIILGPRFLGNVPLRWTNWGFTTVLLAGLLGVMVVRSHWFLRWLSQTRWTPMPETLAIDSNEDDCGCTPMEVPVVDPPMSKPSLKS